MVIRFIRGAREAMNNYKREFDGVREQGSHEVHWDRGGFTDIGSRRLRTARDSVADMAEAKTEMTAEAAVCKGAMVQTPTSPHQDRQKLGVADRTVAKEVGWRRRNDGLGGWGNIREVRHRRPQEKRNIREVSHRRPQEKLGSVIGTHRP